MHHTPRQSYPWAALQFDSILSQTGEVEPSISPITQSLLHPPASPPFSSSTSSHFKHHTQTLVNSPISPFLDYQCRKKQVAPDSVWEEKNDRNFIFESW